MRSAFVLWASLAAGAAVLSPAFSRAAAAQVAPDPFAGQRPVIWISEHSTDPGLGQYGWLIGYSAAALRSRGTGLHPASVIVVPGFDIDDVSVNAGGVVFARYAQWRSEPNFPVLNFQTGFFAYDPTASGVAPHQSVSLGSHPIGDFAVDPAGNAYAVQNLYGDASGNHGPVLLTASIGRPAMPFTDNPSVTGSFGRIIDAPIAMAVSRTGIVATADFPEPPANAGQINLITGMSVNRIYPGLGTWPGTGAVIGGLAFDRSDNLIALVQNWPVTSLLKFNAGPNGPSTVSRRLDIPMNRRVGQNDLAVDGDGYVYVLSPQERTIFVYSPSLDLATPVSTFVCCPDPTTPDGAIAVAPGLRAPNNAPTSIAAQR